MFEKIWHLIKSLCETNEDGSLRLRNYPGKLMGDFLAFGMDEDLCLCCIAIRVWIMIVMSFIIGYML